jgi:hypothetical protein
MQATARFHASVTHAVLQETDLVLHSGVAVHPAHRVFDPDADGRERTIGRVLQGREFTPARFLRGWDDGHSGPNTSREAPLLRETTPRGARRARQIGAARIRPLASIGGAQNAHLTGGIEHEAVVARGALLRATVMRWLCFRVARTRDWAVSPLRPPRGGLDPSCAWGAARRAANAAAVRAGTRSWWAHA